MLPKRDWMEMTAEDFAAAARWIAVLPVAAVEQHGPHLPLGVDTHIAEAYLKRVRELIPAELPVTFLPIQAIGASEEHRAFPGTVTLAAETMVRAVTEIGESVYRAGVAKLVIVTSHGGNVQANGLAALNLRTRLGMLAVTTSWHGLGYPKGLFTDAEHRHGIHAGDIETSLMLSVRPDLVATGKAQNFASSTGGMAKENKWLGADPPAALAWMSQDLHPSGAAGDATIASAEKGRAALDHGARAFVELLAEVDRFDLAKLGRGPLG